MASVHVRRQGGAAVMTIPADALRALGIEVGSELAVAVTDGALVARPVQPGARRRYSLAELLRGATPDAVRRLADDTDWARDGEPVGREL